MGETEKRDEAAPDDGAELREEDVTAGDALNDRVREGDEDEDEGGDGDEGGDA